MKRIRKLLLISLFATISSTSAFALQNTGAVPLTLKQNMKQLGIDFKQLVIMVKDPTQNAASAALAGEMISLFKAAQVEVPDLVAQLPTAQQPAALAEFQATIQKEIDATTDLQKAFLANDTKTAIAILQQMNATKKAAHNKFDPDPKKPPTP
jgi:hypothetical protein